MHLVNRLFDGRRNPTELAQELVERADSQKTDIHAIIISDEDIAMRTQLAPFVEMRKDFNVKVVVSLRRQDLWLESWYLQNIKWQWDKTLAHLGLDDFMARTEEFHWIDYDRYLMMLEQSFGRENVLAYVFERGQMPGGPIETFARTIGLETEGLTEPVHRNASFSPVIAEFVRRMPLDLVRPRLRAVFESAFGEIDAALEKTAAEASGLLLDPARRAEVLARYAAGNRAVAERYFARDTLFFDPLPPADAPLGALRLPAESEELMSRIVEPMMRDLVQKLDTLIEPAT